MTDEQKEVRKIIKAFNQRIVRLGEKYGMGSLVYKRITSQFKKILPPALQPFLKLSARGFLAFDQTLPTISYILGTGRLMSLLTAGEKLITLTEYGAQLKQAMQFEDIFSNFSEEIKETKGYKNGKSTEATFSQIKEAVNIYKQNHPKDNSDPYKDIEGMHRVPTYWELYRSFCRYEGLDWKDEIGSCAELANPTRAHATSKERETAARLAQQIRESEGVDLYGKPSNPNG